MKGTIGKSIAAVAVILLFAGTYAIAQDAENGGSAASAEVFDVSGLPPEPTNFTEQRLQAMLADHKTGDLGNAALIQDLIAKDYQDRGDQTRARAAEQRAASARKTARGY